MASMGDPSFKQMLLFGKNLGTASPVGGAALLNSSRKQLLGRGDGGEEGRGIFGRGKGLLDIDLNVAPPEEGDDGSDGEEGELTSVNGFDCSAAAHWFKWENKANGFDCLDEEEEMVENMTISDDEKGKTETEMRIRRWNAILRVAEDETHDYEKNKSQNRKLRTIPVVELKKSLAKKKIPDPNIDTEWLLATASSPPPPVVRSTRGRAVALPNKYRDSVLDGVVETAAFLRHNRICNKSAAVVSSKRKSR